MIHFTGILLRVIKQCPLFSDLCNVFGFSVPWKRERNIRVKLIDATVNFFSAVAGNFTLKTKRKSNLASYKFILCLQLPRSIMLFFSKILKSDSIFIDTKNVSSSSKIIKLNIYWK